MHSHSHSERVRENLRRLRHRHCCCSALVTHTRAARRGRQRRKKWRIMTLWSTSELQVKPFDAAEREKEKFELNPGDRAVEWLNIATVCGIINNMSENLDEVEAKQTQHKNNGKTFEWISPHFTSILQPSWVRFACTSIFHIFLLTPSARPNFHVCRAFSRSLSGNSFEQPSEHQLKILQATPHRK